MVIAAGCGDDDEDKKVEAAPLDASTGHGGEDGLGRDMDARVEIDGERLSDGGIGRLPDGALAGDGGCDVIDPHFGCGRQTGDWVRFESGLEVDRASGLAWAPVQAPSGAHGEDAAHYCQDLNLQGISEFSLPTIDQVRTLSAGCESARPGGGCRVAHGSCVGPECAAGDACRACEPGKGPHASGGYCRPELGECVNAWALTACDDLGPSGNCPSHRHWYYDVQTGSFALAELPTQLSGRCVARMPR